MPSGMTLEQMLRVMANDEPAAEPVSEPAEDAEKPRPKRAAKGRPES